MPAQSKSVSIFSKDTLMPMGFVILLLGLITTANTRMTESEFMSTVNAQNISKIDERVDDLEDQYFESLLEISQRLEGIETTLKIEKNK